MRLVDELGKLTDGEEIRIMPVGPAAFGVTLRRLLPDGDVRVKTTNVSLKEMATTSEDILASALAYARDVLDRKAER